MIITLILAGLSEIEEELQSDLEDTPVKTLCTSTLDSSLKLQFTILRFSAAAKLFPIIGKFNTMIQERGSTIFLKVWMKHLNAAAAQKKGQLTFSEVVEMAWEPSFQECATLLDQLHDGTIPMAVVDDYFKQLDKANVVLRLKALTLSIDRCHSRSPPSHSAEKWARSVADNMQKHWTVRKYSDAATIFLQLKKQLELTGDFQAVEDLQSMVGSSSVPNAGVI